MSAERTGLTLENSYSMGEILNGVSGLDINAEKEIIEHKLNELGIQRASDKEITQSMKDLGIQRTRFYGLPNTYVFTKAMGEMMIGELKGTLPAVIIRPTIITSTLKEPFPGWAEGVRTIDSLIIGYAKGKLTFFLGDVDAAVDLTPVDMVVNAMVVAMVAHASNQPSETIYHVGSSMRNPITYRTIQDFSYHYFSKKPWIDNDEKPVIVGKVRVTDTMASFHRYMALRFLLPRKCLLINSFISVNHSLKFDFKAVFHHVGVSREGRSGYGGALRFPSGVLRALFSGPVLDTSSDFATIVGVKMAVGVFEEAGWGGVLESNFL
ncbi:Fatty acyl-CoA reductase 3 [Hibiscus syriacus]|uniref:Fatty acyl-CoA reductase n=1 Tax=Hibiscus syriacus TaxID=106335 RepID=A0A6A2ZYF0_HIBSY|nr:Fatty acyl-CoA reductase 3 [Hibiscus syriacus]